MTQQGLQLLNNNIEKEGIRRTRKLFKEADIILNITENDETFYQKSKVKKNG